MGDIKDERGKSKASSFENKALLKSTQMNHHANKEGTQECNYLFL